MSTRTEAMALADTFEFTRGLTRYYMSRLKGHDMKKIFEVEGRPLNSAYWLVAHLVWAENMLLLRSLYGPTFDKPWLQRFGFGSDATDQKGWPDFSEIIAGLKEVHIIAMDHLRSLPDEKLDAPNLTQLGLGQEPTYRTAIQHAIRHEGTHAGHLGWLTKLYDVKTL